MYIYIYIYIYKNVLYKKHKRNVKGVMEQNLKGTLTVSLKSKPYMNTY